MQNLLIMAIFSNWSAKVSSIWGIKKYAYIHNPYHYQYRVEFFQTEQEANEFKHKMLLELISEFKKYDNGDSNVDRECFVDDEIYNRLYRTREEKCKKLRRLVDNPF